MRTIILFIVIIPFFANAQSSEKPGKIRFQSGFFSNHWEIGDKSVKQKDIGLHLEKYSPKSYTEFAFMRKSQKSAVVWDIITSVGILGAAFSKDTETTLGFSVIGLTGATGLLICAINEGKHRKRALKTYNTAYGY